MVSHRLVALDVEFVKCRGRHFVRSAAFVPFGRVGVAGAYRTCLDELPRVISMDNAAVMRDADVLPCGDVLLPSLSALMVGGAALDDIKSTFQADARQAFDSYRATHRDHRERLRNDKKTLMQRAVSTSSTNDAAVPIEDDAEEEECLLSTTSASTLGALSAEEVYQRRHLQMRLAITENFDLLDPYGIPNVQRLNRTSLRHLYCCRPDSAAFAVAAQHVMPLRAYGRGRGRHKSLAFLARYHPTFLQAVLHASFPSAESWVDFLEACAEVSSKELAAVADHHRSILPDTHLRRSANLEALSMDLNSCWSYWLHYAAACKFFVYGNADAKVIHTTLHHSCSQVMRATFSERAIQAGGAAAGKPRGSIRGVPKDGLLSPYQAKVTDVTGHTLFRASGFMRSDRKVPNLLEALQKVVGRDVSAAGLWAEQRFHDPLWDARALACVCVGTGLFR